MDATQATQIRTLLLEAADAIDRASAIVSTLDSEDRAVISASLDKIRLLDLQTIDTGLQLRAAARAR